MQCNAVLRDETQRDSERFNEMQADPERHDPEQRVAFASRCVASLCIALHLHRVAQCIA
jgi:hypothetical protein